jgi:hypothetical protein
MTPGGTAWEGKAADAAQDRSFADLVKVRSVAEHLRDAATAARRGADDLYYARRSALDAVERARDAGFVVGEDLSVASRQTDGTAAVQAQRAALAERYSTNIGMCASELGATDKRVAAMITTATASVAEVRFADAPTENGPPRDSNGVQLFDAHTFKEGPPIPVPGTPDDPVGSGVGPSAADIRGVLDSLPKGNGPGIWEVRTPQDLENLWKWLRQSGVELPNGYGDPAKGTAVMLPDGTRVGLRLAAGSTGQPVVDVKIPGERERFKVHINPRGGVPLIPLAPPPAVVEPTPRLPVPVEPPPVRGGSPFGGFGGAIPEGLLPRVVELPQAGGPDLPVIGDGQPDHPDA